MQPRKKQDWLSSGCEVDVARRCDTSPHTCCMNVMVNNCAVFFLQCTALLGAMRRTKCAPKAALKAQPIKLLNNFGTDTALTHETRADAEKFLSICPGLTCKSSVCTEIVKQFDGLGFQSSFWCTL